MTVDPKTARHECNVIKRLVLRCYPRLHIHYILHGENEREKSFAIESRQFTLHPAGKYILEHPDKKHFQAILKRNRSRFVCITRQDSLGFLGFFQQKYYLALCFMNYDRFDSIETFRNHAYHIAWHAIALHDDYEEYISTNKEGAPPFNFKDENNVLTPSLSLLDYSHRNLLGDIFSACIQTVQGRKEAFSLLAKHRITHTLQPTTGFRAEYFPFPMCLDTLEYVFKNNISQEKAKKHPVLSSTKITKNIGTTYEPTSIEQWRSFSTPVQQMAWTGYDAQTILGTALYTSENTYAQSISDMVAERMSINPKVVTTIQDFNPFTTQDVNARMHRKLCLDLLYNLLAHIITPDDYEIVSGVIEKQNMALIEGKVMGWCIPALTPIKELIRECPNKDMLPDLLTQAMKMFDKEIDDIPWETLEYLSRLIFLHRRKNRSITMEELLEITAEDEELSSIHYSLNIAQKLRKNTY
ncbi:MAG: hypothetical protein KAJ40_01415 [Alphaproteobacteria bacterium]|nr:hypothetical protein [Alphaproteobacteria bacterium]